MSSRLNGVNTSANFGSLQFSISNSISASSSASDLTLTGILKPPIASLANHHQRVNIFFSFAQVSTISENTIDRDYKGLCSGWCQRHTNRPRLPLLISMSGQPLQESSGPPPHTNAHYPESAWRTACYVPSMETGVYSGERVKD